MAATLVVITAHSPALDAALVRTTGRERAGEAFRQRLRTPGDCEENPGRLAARL